MTMGTLFTYCVNVAWISELRLPGSVHMTVNIPHSDAVFHIYKSVVSDSTGRHEVALALGDVRTVLAPETMNEKIHTRPAKTWTAVSTLI